MQSLTKESWWLLPGRWSVLLPSLGLWLPGVISVQLNICAASWKIQRNIKRCDPHDTMLLCPFKWILFWNIAFSCFFLCERSLCVQWSCLAETETLLCFPNCKPWKKHRWNSNLSWYWNFSQEILHFHSAFVKSEDMWFYREVKPKLRFAVFCKFCLSDYQEKRSCNTSKF